MAAVAFIGPYPPVGSANIRYLRLIFSRALLYLTRRCLVKSNRKAYESPHRREQLEATRRRVLEAARRLFNERGYEATTVKAIADAAGVAVPTVYKHFGSKFAILRMLIDSTINVRVPAELQRVLAEGAPEARLRALARMCVALASRAADVIAVAIAAAGGEPEISRFVDQQDGGRRANAELIAHSLAEAGALRLNCSVEEARDVMWALAGPQTYRLLAIQGGWGDERFETWLGDTLLRLLMP
jgi:AcrR family transcriptional regulator